MKNLTLILLFFMSTNALCQNIKIGQWSKDALGLPCFQFTENVPITTTLPTGEKANVPEDPWFLLGNYQLTMFVHVSGEYQLITGQRAWARMNQKISPNGVIPNSGENCSTIEILDKNGATKQSLKLTGCDGLAADSKSCKRLFGCGFANFIFKTNNLEIERKIEVAPSRKFNDGESAFVLTVNIKNKSNKPISLNYNESILANYMQIQYQRQANTPIKFACEISTKDNIIKADFHATTNDPLMLSPKDEISYYDAYPPSLFVCNLNNGKLCSDDFGNLISTDKLTISANGKKTLKFVIGYIFEGDNISDMVNSLIAKNIENEWFTVLPTLADEKDENLRQDYI